MILWGGLLTNLIWTSILSFRNKSYRDFTNRSTPLKWNYMFAALAGTTWFMQFFFYGMGESKLGNGASSWILHMSTIILTANMWGIYRKEWKGVARKTKLTIAIGQLSLQSENCPDTSRQQQDGITLLPTRRPAKVIHL